MIKFALTLSAAALLAATASAQSFNSPSSQQLTSTLSGKSIAYAGGATQRFNRDGTTSAKGLSGSWSVSGSQLCTKWSGVPDQSCVSVQIGSDGSSLRLRAPDGRTWNASLK